ncbi:hypothetical protein EZV62_012465 [Acer yangbiense]|uniref:Retrovirus-related Pol polyprotein from transposon TNT 1-94-like beta-barrel domain-containing protein n=1 Tax=Acer yangbiense TaxID=1000413 RepID=A0A5C7HY62_9ROSI|nr:hypothetical protein EZV62_012465 [Acer yangbiense]
MKKDVLSLVMGEIGTAFVVWAALEPHHLPITVEKESNLKRLLMEIKKGSHSIDEYLKQFKNIYENLAAIQKPLSDIDKVLQFASGFGNQYMDFRTTILSKPPLPSFQQFILALQGHEQTLLSNREDEKRSIEHAQAFFSQREGRGRGGRGSGILSSLQSYNGNDVIYVSNGNGLPISHIGDMSVSTKDEKFKLNNVLVVSELKKNLLSIGKCTTDNSCIFELTSSDFVVKDQTKRVITRGHKKGQLYALDGVFHEALSAIRSGDTSSSIWHQRLRHPNSRLLSILKEENVNDISN